jgi:hypothetical protein
MYYPKSQIEPNLYTNGEEYVISSTDEGYKGFYYEISSGQSYTGKYPGDGQNVLLTPSTFITNKSETSNNFTSPTIIEPFDSTPLYPNQTTPPTRSIPLSNPTLPTTQDQQNGQFNRYFCKRTNENRYMEIDFNTYSQLQSQDPKIAWDLYNPTLIIWLIQGNKEQVYNSNKGSAQSVEQNLKWYGFTQYFKDNFLKYYLGS